MGIATSGTNSGSPQCVQSKSFRTLEIKEKRPRVCSWEQLEKLADNCEFAGVLVRKKNDFPVSKKRHAQLCQSFKTFVDESPDDERRNIRHFPDNAEDYQRFEK